MSDAGQTHGCGMCRRPIRSGVWPRFRCWWSKASTHRASWRQHYQFDPRQSSYYRQAAEFLGLVSQDKRSHRYHLTDLGREYVSRPADERRQLLAGLLAHFRRFGRTGTVSKSGCSWHRQEGNRKVHRAKFNHWQFHAGSPGRDRASMAALATSSSRRGSGKTTKILPSVINFPLRTLRLCAFALNQFRHMPPLGRPSLRSYGPAGRK